VAHPARSRSDNGTPVNGGYKVCRPCWVDFTYPSPNLYVHPLVYLYCSHTRVFQIIPMDSFLSTDTLSDWLKLILIGNFLNAHVLSSVVSYAWGALMRRFYTTIEFDEFDSTFCERGSPGSHRIALTLCMSLSLDQRLAGPATGVVHGSRPLHHNPIFRSRDRSFQTVRRVSRWRQRFRGPQSQEATIVLRYYLSLVQEPLPSCDEDKDARYRARWTPNT